MNLTLLNQANQDWENFADNLSNEEKKGLSEFSEAASSNSLHYLAATKDVLRFDQKVNKLSRRYLYDDELIPTVYNFYVERDLHELAFDYLRKAEEYFSENGSNIPQAIQTILDNSESVQLLAKYKISLDRIRGLSPINIPKITPETINDKRQLNKFILGEIIQSLRIIREKIEALRQVTHENRFNDFLQAILRLRLPIWGWSIQDQPRLGTSTGGADAGNADLIIQSGGGTNIALIEAFNLKENVGVKKDKDYTELHILKCPKYIGTIDKYYAIVYFLGNSSDFENKWSTYMSDVLSISYPSTFTINKAVGFTDIASEFNDVINIKIAKTIHNSNLEMFHVMINLGL